MQTNKEQNQSDIEEQIDEILRTKIEIQFPESLAPNPVVIYGEALEALTALIHQAERKAKLSGMNTVNSCHDCINQNEWLKEIRDELQALLKGSNDE